MAGIDMAEEHGLATAAAVEEEKLARGRVGSLTVQDDVGVKAAAADQGAVASSSSAIAGGDGDLRERALGQALLFEAAAAVDLDPQRAQPRQV